MQPEQKQRIVLYFIEEANEHLGTIEQGLLNLQATIADPESLNDVYRAAHSVKGGAAMLGLSSIQKTAHCLEDGFKIFKEHSVKLDLRLKSLLDRTFGFLQSLLEQLQAFPDTFEERVAQSVAQIEPTLAEVRAHLNWLLSHSDAALSQELEIATQELAAAAHFEERTEIAAANGLDLAGAGSTPWQRSDPAVVPLGTEIAASREASLNEEESGELEVGSLELGSLADLFEGEVPELGLPWQADELLSVTSAEETDAGVERLVNLEPNERATASADMAMPIENSASEDRELADLEALLGGAAQPTTVDELSNFLDELSDQVSEPENTFNSTSTDHSDASFADLEDLLTAKPVRPSDSATDKADFSDLEDLLNDTTEKLGGPSPTPIRRSPAPTNRSLVRGTRPTSAVPDPTMRVPIKQLDNLNNLVGELVVNRNSLEQDQEKLRQSLDNLLYQVQQINDAGQRMRDLYERSLLEISLLASRKERAATLAAGHSMLGVGSAQSTTSIGLALDALEMDRFSGFHLLAQDMIELIVRIRESSSDIEFIVDEMEQVSRMFRQATTQLQENLTRSRMVPFAQIADRLPRAVRDISLKCGKQAELVVEGRDTLIDKMILEQLYDPMTHLVNNAIAHGIEPPEIRQASGKNVVGRITIRTFHQGNQTIISVSDDGAGIDPIKVKAKAIQRGLITPAQAEALSQVDVYDLLFQPGFSTRDQADDFAGRGVGMDVVRTSLNEIRGDVITDSTLGKGTTFTIRLPLTLSISKALCCVSNHAQIAFPMDGVEDVVDVPTEDVQTNEQGQPYIRWRETNLPFRPLNELLHFNRQIGRSSIYGTNQQEDVTSIIVLRSGSNLLALQVDQVLGEREIVIKQLEGPVPKPIGIAGATVQGDGHVMAIADVLELIEIGMGRVRRDVSTFLWDQNLPPLEEPPAKTEPMVLIVDDSITVRELLSMTFAKVGYRVEQARDGQEAWEKLRAGLPCDLIFCDIEMPRMDGLELLSRVQKDPNLSHLPIAMLTSRGADRHRQLAAQLGASGYFTKPYLEESLLDAAQRMLRGEVLLTTKAGTAS